MKPPRRARKITGYMQLTAVRAGTRPEGLGVKIEFPDVGAEIEQIRVRFRYKDEEYEADVFDEFTHNTEPIPEDPD